MPVITGPWKAKPTRRKSSPQPKRVSGRAPLATIPKVKPVCGSLGAYHLDKVAGQVILREIAGLGTFVSDSLAIGLPPNTIDRVEAAHAIAFWSEHRGNEGKLAERLLSLPFDKMMKFLRYYPDRESVGLHYGTPLECVLAGRLSHIAKVNEDIAIDAFRAMSNYPGFPEKEEVFNEMTGYPSFARKVLLTFKVEKAARLLEDMGRDDTFRIELRVAGVLFAKGKLSKAEETKRNEIARKYFENHGGKEQLDHYRTAAFWSRRFDETHESKNNIDWKELAEEMKDHDPELLDTIMDYGPWTRRVEIWISLYHRGYQDLTESLVDAYINRKFIIFQERKKDAYMDGIKAKRPFSDAGMYEGIQYH